MAAKHIVLLTLVALLGFAQTNASFRILEGGDAASGQYPWATSVRINNAHKCMGSIIGNRHILTRGGCVSHVGTASIDPKTVTCRVGSTNQYSGGQIMPVESIHIHPSYGNFIHDIAVLVLTKDLTFTDKIQKIAYAKEDDEIQDGAVVTLTGWGVQKSGATPYKLQHANFSVISPSECELQAGFGYEHVICLSHKEGEGTCKGDEGTGVVSQNKLVGVASFAFGACGTKYPDVAARVSYYASWLDANIQ